jgi:hypothetical protein
VAPGISENLHTPVIYIGVHIYLFIQFNLFIYLFIYECSRLKFIYDFWSNVVWCQAQQELDRRAWCQILMFISVDKLHIFQRGDQMSWEVNITLVS